MTKKIIAGTVGLLLLAGCCSCPEEKPATSEEKAKITKEKAGNAKKKPVKKSFIEIKTDL